MWDALTGSSPSSLPSLSQSSSRPSPPPPPLTKEEKNFLDEFINNYYDADGDFDSTKKNFLDVTTSNRQMLESMCYEIEKSN